MPAAQSPTQAPVQRLQLQRLLRLQRETSMNTTVCTQWRSSAQSHSVVPHTGHHALLRYGTTHCVASPVQQRGCLLLTLAVLVQRVFDIAAGEYHAALVHRTAGMCTWGQGASGRLGHGDTRDIGTPRLVEALQVSWCVCVFGLQL